MSVRVTTNMLFRTGLADVSRQRARLARTQEQATSGLRINRPSDDPVGARDATVLRSAIEALAQLDRNHGRAEERLRAMEAALDDGLDVLQRARELAVAGASGTFDATSRQALAAEVEQLHARLVTRANTRVSGSYVFGGYLNDAPPFVAGGAFASGSPPPGVSFVGDPSEVEVEIEPGARVASTLDGRRVFQGDADGDGTPDAGREDVFGVLGDLWQALDTNDPAATAAVLDRIERAHDQLNLERTRLGALQNRIDAARTSVGLQLDDTRRRLSEVQDADAARVFSELVVQETALQASLQATARLLQPSLMDFLS